VKKALFDTNILSYFLKGNVELAKRFQQYSRYHQRLTFSLLTYYEIKSGLLYRDASKLMAQFEQLATEISYRFICVHLRSSAVFLTQTITKNQFLT
jgi:predicted nucleic acid-binding protein